MSDMSGLWIGCAIVFAGVVLAVHALYRIVSRAQRDRNTIKRRLTASVGDGVRRTPIEVLRQERGLANFDHPRLAALDEFLVQTGLRISVLTLGLSTLSLSALVALALSLFLSQLWVGVGEGLGVGAPRCGG